MLVSTPCLHQTCENAVLTIDRKFNTGVANLFSYTHILIAMSFSLLTWNIYGLQPSHLCERTEYICKYILEHAPSIVFLQEVVHRTWPLLTSQLSGAYHCFNGKPKAHYFPAMLVKKQDEIQCQKESIIDFPSSGQGRYLIQVPITFRGVEITFLSSHIESMNEQVHIKERKAQLQTAFNKMEEIRKSGGVAVFGGDTNTFDEEIKEIGLPSLVQDTWVHLGSDKKKCKTWNTNFPVHRPDRIYFGPTNGSVIPVTFDLIGKDRVPNYGCYPSDHLGIWINFEVKG